MRNRDLWAAILVLYLCISTVYATRYWLESGNSSSSLARLSDKSSGNPAADLKILEFFDYQCGACGKAYQVIREAMAKHPGRIYLEARFYPLDGHLFGRRTALYSQCAAAQKKFWPWHDLLFQKQAEWAALKSPAEAETQFKSYASEIGLNISTLDRCLADPGTQKAVADDRQYGVAMGVRSTPSFFINGKFVVGAAGLTQAMDSYFSAPAPANDAPKEKSDVQTAVYA